MNSSTEYGPLAVVKVGGSLLTWPELPTRLSRWLDAERPDRVVLIVGGGSAADFVRALDAAHQLGDEPAHRLALLAMDLTAEALARLLPGSRVVRRAVDLGPVWSAGLRPILAPRTHLEEIDEGRADRLPFSWSVTSDSIAARVAVDLGARRLALLKSTAAVDAASRTEAARVGLVDPWFPTASEPIDRVEVVAFRDPGSPRRVLMR